MRLLLLLTVCLATFVNGYQDTYEYVIQTTVGAPQTSAQHAVMQIRTNVIVARNPSKQNELVMRMFDTIVKLDEAKTIDNPEVVLPIELLGQPLPSVQKLVQKMLPRYPVSFEIRDGKIARLRHHGRDPYWVVNIKKGLVSLLQYKPEAAKIAFSANDEAVFNTTLPTTSGLCDTLFTYKKRFGVSEPIIEATRQPDFQQCVDPLTGLRYMVRTHIISPYTPEECQGSCKTPASITLPIHSTKYQLRTGPKGPQILAAESTNVHSILIGRHVERGTIKLTIRQKLVRISKPSTAPDMTSIEDDQLVRAPELLVAVMPTDIPRQLSQNANVLREVQDLHEEFSNLVMEDKNLNEDVPRLTHALLKLMMRMTKEQLIDLINHSAKFSHGRIERSWLHCKQIMAHMIDMLTSVGTTEAFDTIMHLIEQSTERYVDGTDKYLNLVLDESRVQKLFRGLNTWKNVEPKMLRKMLSVIRSDKFLAKYFIPTVSRRVQVFRAAWLAIGSLSNTLFVDQFGMSTNIIRFYSANNQTNVDYLQKSGQEVAELKMTIFSQLTEMLKERTTRLLGIKAIGNTAQADYFDILVKQFERTSNSVERQAIVSSLTLLVKSMSNKAYDDQIWMLSTNSYLSTHSYGKLFRAPMQKYKITMEAKYTMMARMHAFILMVIRDNVQAPSVRFEALRVLVASRPFLSTLSSAVEAIRSSPEFTFRNLAISYLVEVSKRVDPCLKSTSDLIRPLLNTFTPMDIERSSSLIVSKGFHDKKLDFGGNMFVAAMTPENSFIPSHIWLKTDYIETKLRSEFVEVNIATQNIYQQLQALISKYTNSPIYKTGKLDKQIEKLRLQMLEEKDTSVLISVKQYGREVMFLEPSVSDMTKMVASPEQYLSILLKPIEDIHDVSHYIRRNPTPSGLLMVTDHIVVIHPHVSIDNNVQATWSSWTSAMRKMEVTVRKHLHYWEEAKLSVVCGPIEVAQQYNTPISITPCDVKLVASYNNGEASLKLKKLLQSETSVFKFKVSAKTCVKVNVAEVPSHVTNVKSESKSRKMRVHSAMRTKSLDINDEWVSPYLDMKAVWKVRLPENRFDQDMWIVPMDMELLVSPQPGKTETKWIDFRLKLSGDMFKPDTPFTTSFKMLLGTSPIFSMTEEFHWNGDKNLKATGDMKIELRQVKDGKLTSHMQKLRIKYQLELPKYLDYDMSIFKGDRIELSDLPSLIDTSRKMKFEMKFLQSEAEKEFMKLKLTTKSIATDKFTKVPSSELQETIPYLKQCLREQETSISTLDSKHTPACVNLYFYLNSLSDMKLKAEFKPKHVSKLWKSDWIWLPQYMNAILLPYLKESKTHKSDKVEVSAEVRPTLVGQTMYTMSLKTPLVRNIYSGSWDSDMTAFSYVQDAYVSIWGSDRFESNECKIMSSHIRTFDDLSYTLPKSELVNDFSSDSLSPHVSTLCDMLVAKDCSASPKFFITLKQRLVDNKVLNTYNIRILGSTIKFTASANDDPELLVNGAPHTSSSYKDEFVVIQKLPFAAPSTLYSINSPILGVNVIVGSSRGRVFRLQVAPWFYSRVCGMCGNNNGIRTDEFSVPTMSRHFRQPLDAKLHPSMLFLIPNDAQSVCEKMRNYFVTKMPQPLSMMCRLSSDSESSSDTWSRVVNLRGMHSTPFSKLLNKFMKRADCDKLSVLQDSENNRGLKVFTDIKKQIIVQYNDGSILLSSESNKVKIHINTPKFTKTISADELEGESTKYEFSNGFFTIREFVPSYSSRTSAMSARLNVWAQGSLQATIVYTSMEAKLFVANRFASYNGICASDMENQSTLYRLMQVHLSVPQVSACLKDVSARYESHPSSCRILPGVFSPGVETIDSLKSYQLPILSRMMNDDVSQNGCPIVLAKGQVGDEQYAVTLRSVSGKPSLSLRIGDTEMVNIVKKSAKTLSVEVNEQPSRKVTAGAEKYDFDLYAQAFKLFSDNHLYIVGMQKSDHAEIAIHVIKKDTPPNAWSQVTSSPKELIIRVITWTQKPSKSIPTIIVTPADRKTVETGLCKLTERNLEQSDIVAQTLASLSSDDQCRNLAQSHTEERRFCRIATSNYELWVTPFKVPSDQQVYGMNHKRHPKCPINLATFSAGGSKVNIRFEGERKSSAAMVDTSSEVVITVKSSSGSNVFKITNKDGSMPLLSESGDVIRLIDGAKKVFGDSTVSIKAISSHSAYKAKQVKIYVPSVMEIYAVLRPSATTLYFRPLTSSRTIASGVCDMTLPTAVSDIFALHHEALDSGVNCQSYRPF